MKVGTKLKLIVGIVVILVVGFIWFQMLNVESPVIKIIKPVAMPEGEKITPLASTEHGSETVTETQQEAVSTASPEIEEIPVPETVPTAQSSDEEIREFQEWISTTLVEEDANEEMEQADLKAEDNGVDYDLESAAIKSVIEDQWKNSLETFDIEGYMSAIWEDDFFYASDMGTPDDVDDDVIFRSGHEERIGALNMFGAYDNIELSLYRNGDIEFLSETVAMADYDYGLKLISPTHGTSYPSGRMFFILEQRGDGEWRILEWYDLATPDPNR